MNFRLAVSVMGVALLANLGGAQEPSPMQQLDAPAVLRMLDTPGGVDRVGRLMRQVDSRFSRRLLDEFADSLLSVVMAHEADPAPKASYALFVLGASGRSEGEGIPYSGAGQRLEVIGQRSASYSGGAILSLSELADRSDAVARLRRIATSSAAGAEEAVRALEGCCDELGINALRDLHRAGNAGSDQAKSALRRIAGRRGWRANPNP